MRLAGAIDAPEHPAGWTLALPGRQRRDNPRNGVQVACACADTWSVPRQNSKRDSSNASRPEQDSPDVRIEGLERENERQTREIDPAELSTGAEERRDMGNASQPAPRTMPATPPNTPPRLPVRPLGEYVFGGRVDAMRRLLRGR